MSRSLPVQYLFNRECPSHEEGRALLEQAAQRAGVELDVTVTEIVDDEQAHAHEFYGSPTFILGGDDPFDPPEGVPIAAEACRAYHRSDGRIGPLPSLDDLSDALSRAATKGTAP